MNKIPCTVGILTFNSAKTLRRALESVSQFDDIIICDGGSTDMTLDIAREFGARVIAQDQSYKNPNGSLKDYSGPRNQCLDSAKHDWFFYIDSDETISDGLREDIRGIATSSLERKNPLVYRVPIGIMMDGRYIEHSSNYPGYQTRFFNKRSIARFVRPVHERIEFDETKVRVGTLTHPWYVHTTREYWLHYIKETSAYRPIEVKRACNDSFFVFLRYGLLWSLRISIVVLLKSIYNYGRYGFAKTLPVRGELGRAVAPLILVGKVMACKLRKMFVSD